MIPLIPVLIALIIIYVAPKVHRLLSNQSRIRQFSSKIPGPPAVPIFGNALSVPKQTKDMTEYFVRLAEEYSSKGQNLITFWLAHHLRVIPLNGETVKDILENQTEITKSNDYEIVTPWLGTGLLISTGEKWRTRRKMLTPTFHFKMLDSYVGTFNRQSVIFTEVIEKFADTKETVDIFHYIKRCALDIICESAMGYELNSQTDHNVPYALAVGEMGYITADYGLKPWFWLKPIFYLFGDGFKYEKTLQTLTDFTKHVIADRKRRYVAGEIDTNSSRKAFLDMLLEMREANSLSDEDIREEVDTFMFEGHDTTSSGIAWILWCLATMPEIQQKVADEIFAVFGDSDREISTTDLAQMNYLDLVVKESMRINPPVPFIGRNLQNDLQIGGYVVPKGSQVLIAPLMIHRNSQVYPDPLRFDPNRFLPENVKKRHAYDYIPFSAGPRNCIGQKFALYEEKIMVTWLLRKYKFSTNFTFSDEANARCPEIVLRPEHGIPVQITKREWC